MSLEILGIGTALPETCLTQDHAAELTSHYSAHGPEQSRRLATLYRRTGIRTRHVVLLDHGDLPRAGAVENGNGHGHGNGHDNGMSGPSTRWRMLRYDEQVRPLARQAATRALDAAGIAPGMISHLVTVSCTGFAAPGFDLALVRDLGLVSTVERTHVGFMGCHGALNGLRVARALTHGQRSACVLLCAAELCSLHFQYGERSDLAVANALFADGAAALVGTSVEDEIDVATENGLVPTRFWRLAANGSCLIPETEDVMTWQIGDHGFEMTLSPRVSHLIGVHLRGWLKAWLGRHGVGLEEVGSWAIHPGGPRVLDAVEETLGLDRDATAASRAVLAECGNMSSPTILMIIDRLQRQDAPRPCVALAFGPGLTIEAALFR